jgi:hypothetical protein
MSGNDLPVVMNMDWKVKLMNWSFQSFKTRDLLLELIPYLLKRFPTNEMFNSEHEMIMKILIAHLPTAKADIWKKSEDNLGNQNKDENFADKRKVIKQTLKRQMRKLEEEMFLKPIMNKLIDIDDEEDETAGEDNLDEGEGSNIVVANVNKRKATTTTKKPVRIASNYDGRRLVGRTVCKIFPRIRGSTHKAAYYDGKIVSYDAV